MPKRGRGGVGTPEGGDEGKKKRHAQQDGSDTPQDTNERGSSRACAASGAATGVVAAAASKTLPKRVNVGDEEKDVARQAKKHGRKEISRGQEKDGSGGGGEASGGRSRNTHRKKKTKHEEEGYEGPVEEEDSSSDASEPDGDGSSDESDDSDDDIKLDGALTRRSIAEEEDGEDEVEASGSEAGTGDQQTVVDVCLDFCDPHDRFFHGIRALVAHSYLQDAAGAGLSPLVDLAVAQGAVGTVLSSDAEDDVVFGFVTALPLQYLARENQCAQAVMKYLLEKASKAGRGPEMEKVLGGGAREKVGLLVSERMVNCPTQAVPKLHEALVEDIAWAIENEISQEHRDKFRFDKFVVVAPCDDAVGGGAGSGPAMLSDFFFSRFDDEVLLQEADFIFAMGCAPQSGGGGESASGRVGGPQQRYVVGVIPANKLGDCVQSMAQMVG